MFKSGDVVEVKFSKFWSEHAEVVHQVIRDGVECYQIRYPYNGSSGWTYTEVAVTDLKLSVFNACKRPSALNN